jgi:hypothetical protein
MHLRLCMHKHFDTITNSFKYKCETYQVFIHPFKKNCDDCKMQLVSNGFNTFKVNGSIHA